MKKYPLILIFFIFLNSCAPVKTSAPLPSTPVTFSPLDGEWQETGSTSDGKIFKVFITIQNSALTGLIYKFDGSNGIPCTAITYGQIPVVSWPRIVNNILESKLGDDVNISSTFDSNSKSSGLLMIHWYDRQPYRNGDYEVNWIATKQITQVVEPTNKPAPNTPNLFETFIQIVIFGLSNGALGGAFAGAAGFIFALYYSRPFGSHGAQSGLFAFMAALLGGIGSPVGALISGLLIGVVTSLSDYYLAAQWTPALMLALLVILFVWKPTGFGGERETESVTVRDSIILTASAQGSRVNRWFTLLLIALSVIPLVFRSGQIILGLAAIYILLTLGLNLALGITGMLDLGFATSFGLAAYTTALFTSKFDIVTMLIIGAVVGAFLGSIKGFLFQRLRSDIFAVATLALGLFVHQVIINVDFTGGMGGIGGIRAPHFLTISLLGQTQKYYLVLGIVALAAWISHRLITSRTGRAWIALSENEVAAASLGVDVTYSRTTSLMLSSALTGVAGALYASAFSFVEPDLMAFHVSSMMLTMVILGCAGNVTGAFVGALAIILYDKSIIPQLADWLALIWPRNAFIGSVPDIRGASFFNFGIVLYLTVLSRAKKKITSCGFIPHTLLSTSTETLLPWLLHLSL